MGTRILPGTIGRGTARLMAWTEASSNTGYPDDLATFTPSTLPSRAIRNSTCTVPSIPNRRANAGYRLALSILCRRSWRQSMPPRPNPALIPLPGPGTALSQVPIPPAPAPALPPFAFTSSVGGATVVSEVSLPVVGCSVSSTTATGSCCSGLTTVLTGLGSFFSFFGTTGGDEAFAETGV